MHGAIRNSMNEIMENISDEMRLSLQEGFLEILGIEQPLSLFLGNENEILLLLDTTGNTENLPETGEVFVLTESALMIRNASGEESIFPLIALKDLPPIHIDKVELEKMIPSLPKLGGVIYGLFSFFWILLVKSMKWAMFCMIYLIIRASLGLRGLTNSFAAICLYFFIPTSIISFYLIKSGNTLPMHILTVNILTFTGATLLTNINGDALKKNELLSNLQENSNS